VASVAESMTTTEAFKKRYVDGLRNPVPTSAKLQRMLDFKKEQKLGDEYQWGVSLQLPHGHTWNGGSDYGSLITLNDAQAGQIKTAKAKGCEYLNRTQVPYGVLTKGENGEQAFKPVMDIYMQRLIEATCHGIEMQVLYGGLSIGTIDAGGVGALGGVTFTAVISKATWAAGLFKSSEGMPIDIYEAGTGDAPGAAKRTATGAAKITIVNAATRSVTIQLAAAGDYVGIVATDVIVPFGAKSKWTSGIDDIITTSASGVGTVLGIDVSLYGLWRSNTFAVGGALTMTKFLQATAILSINAGDPADFTEGDGGVGTDKEEYEPYIFLCSPYTQIDLITEQAALRRYTNEREIKKLKNGGEGVILETPVGPVKVVTSTYVKAGHAFFIRASDWHLIGSAQPTFGIPNKPGDEGLILDLPDKNGMEFRRYADLGVVADVLNTSLKLTGIVNASL
jgi:hypothetical protein